MEQHTGISKNILDHIGNTPLIQLNKITKNIPGNFYAKYEGFNPGHSMKDRIALHIIEEGERQGILKKGATIIETTSGNTETTGDGCSVAWLGGPPGPNTSVKTPKAATEIARCPWRAGCCSAAQHEPGARTG